MTQNEIDAGLGALATLRRRPRDGVGIPGPYGANPTEMIPADSYEVSGTQVALRATPGGTEMGRFNNAYGDNGGIIVGEPDKVDFDGQTGTAQGLTWAHVGVSSGALQGKMGYVAVEYLAPIGWTAQQGKTTHNPPQGGGGGGGGGGGNIEPVSNKTVENAGATWFDQYGMYVLGGAGLVAAGIIGYAVYKGGKKGGRKHHTGRHHAHR